MKIKKRFIAAALGLAFGNEVTGHNAFDLPFMANPGCAIDPYCRNLTPGEVREIQRVYGPEFETGTIKMLDRSWYGAALHALGRPIAGISFAGNVFVVDKGTQSADFSKTPDGVDFLIHEVAHVWQSRQGAWRIASGVAHNLIETRGDYSAAYGYKLSAGKSFAAYNIEAQAEMLKDYGQELKKLDIEAYFYGQSSFPGNIRMTPKQAFDRMEARCNGVAELERTLQPVIKDRRHPLCVKRPWRQWPRALAAN